MTGMCHYAQLLVEMWPLEFLPGMFLTPMILLISRSLVAGIVGKSHCHPDRSEFFIQYNLHRKFSINGSY
jgi:hypothetical protein